MERGAAHHAGHGSGADVDQSNAEERNEKIGPESLLVETRPAGLTEDERRELARWRNLARFQPAVIDYLKAQVLIVEKRYGEALAALERMPEGDLVRPGLFLEIADLYFRLGRWRDAQHVYEQALALDPDNAQAHAGMSRVALRKRKFSDAAQSALDALQCVHHYPLAHFLLGLALTGMKEYPRAAEAFGAAISLNPNFPEAHLRLAVLLEKHLGDVDSAREHRRLARHMRSGKRHVSVNADSKRGRLFEDTAKSPLGSSGAFSSAAAELPKPSRAQMPPLEESLIVVTGLPRSGTSMLMQMLAAAGMQVLSDGLREADEDNPRGYLEYEPVKNLLKDSKWMFEQRGKAVKILTPLLNALPAGLACRVILCERDLDEVLDSQERMLIRRNPTRIATPEQRRILKDEYIRTLDRVKTTLASRPFTELLTIQHRCAIADPFEVAQQVNAFLGGGLDAAKMADAIDPALHRNRAGIKG